MSSISLFLDDEKLLLQFPEAGTYEVWSMGLTRYQFFGTGPLDQLLATFNVTGAPIGTPVDIGSLTFTVPPWHQKNITESEITVNRTVTFDVDGNVRVVPFPQFTINEKAFNLSDIFANLTLDGHAEEWNLVSTSNATHPFHIHVVPYQVKSSVTLNSNISKIYDLFTKIDPVDVWRDVVVIPPYGTVKVWIRFDPAGKTPLGGKSVFHCVSLSLSAVVLFLCIHLPFPSPSFSNQYFLVSTLIPQTAFPCSRRHRNDHTYCIYRS